MKWSKINEMYVTSFSSTSYCSNSEHWTQTCIQNGNINSIISSLVQNQKIYWFHKVYFLSNAFLPVLNLKLALKLLIPFYLTLIEISFIPIVNLYFLFKNMLTFEIQAKFVSLW